MIPRNEKQSVHVNDLTLCPCSLCLPARTSLHLPVRLRPPPRAPASGAGRGLGARREHGAGGQGLWRRVALLPRAGRRQRQRRRGALPATVRVVGWWVGSIFPVGCEGCDGLVVWSPFPHNDHRTHTYNQRQAHLCAAHRLLRAQHRVQHGKGKRQLVENRSAGRSIQNPIHRFTFALTQRLKLHHRRPACTWPSTGPRRSTSSRTRSSCPSPPCSSASDPCLVRVLGKCGLVMHSLSL